MKKAIKRAALLLVILSVLTGCAAGEGEGTASDGPVGASTASQNTEGTTEGSTGFTDLPTATSDVPAPTTDSSDPSDPTVGSDTENGEADVSVTEAVYLGVYGYGTALAQRKNMDSFQYRFLIDGEERLFPVDNGPKDEKGAFSYPIQNVLKVGYPYVIEIDGGVVVGASQVMPAWEEQTDRYTPPVSGEPGVKTVKNFLKTALAPVGTTLYIYGGGWNWQDDGAAVRTKTIGLSEDWVTFFRSQDASFTYKDRDGGDASRKDPKNSYYPYNGYNEYYFAGLDCSGFVSWALNNTFNNEKVEDDLFSGAAKAANNLALRGYGTRTQDASYRPCPGDVVTIKGHVWISLGTCDDGSVVIVHSTPSDSRSGQPGGGVQISAVGSSADCQACRLADQYMSRYYGEWYARYPVKLCSPAVYLAFSGEVRGAFRWDPSGANGGLTDPDGFQNMDPSEVLAALFPAVP